MTAQPTTPTNKDDNTELRTEIDSVFWPHPFPVGNLPVQVTFSAELPENGERPLVFVIPYNTFKTAIEALFSKTLATKTREAKMAEWRAVLGVEFDRFYPVDNHNDFISIPSEWINQHISEINMDVEGITAEINAQLKPPTGEK